MNFQYLGIFRVLFLDSLTTDCFNDFTRLKNIESGLGIL